MNAKRFETSLDVQVPVPGAGRKASVQPQRLDAAVSGLERQLAAQVRSLDSPVPGMDLNTPAQLLEPNCAVARDDVEVEVTRDGGDDRDPLVSGRPGEAPLMRLLDLVAHPVVRLRFEDADFARSDLPAFGFDIDLDFAGRTWPDLHVAVIRGQVELRTTRHTIVLRGMVGGRRNR